MELLREYVRLLLEVKLNKRQRDMVEVINYKTQHGQVTADGWVAFYSGKGTAKSLVQLGAVEMQERMTLTTVGRGATPELVSGPDYVVRLVK